MSFHPQHASNLYMWICQQSTLLHTHTHTNREKFANTERNRNLHTREKERHNDARTFRILIDVHLDEDDVAVHRLGKLLELIFIFEKWNKKKKSINQSIQKVHKK
jgi:hypothetical protein